MNSKIHNKVLIADDDPAMLRLLTTHLKSGGYEVITAENGIEALKLAAEECPSYLITDWEMPEMDGLELCRRVRELDLEHYLYIVFLTGRSDERDLVSAIDAGADDFLTKPLRKHELLARLTAGVRVLQLETHLLELADHDALSGLLLRRPFGTFLKKEWHRSRRYKIPLSALMLDIDFFKQVNDTYGHPAGDSVIQGVAKILQDNSRECDIICRYGGEEFCVLLPETNEASAAIWAESVRKRIENETFSIGTKQLQVTISMGLAEILADMEDQQELVDLADQCLLAAKEQGRNRVVTHRELCQSRNMDDSDNDKLDGIFANDVMIPLVHCLRPDWSFTQGAAYFIRYRVSSAPVTDQDGNLLGIVSEKDLMSIAHRSDASDRHLADVMRANVITFDYDAPMVQVLRFLTRASMRSVVITSDGKPVGLITRSTLVRWFIENEWKSEGLIIAPNDAFDDAPDEEEDTMLKLVSLLGEETDRMNRYLLDFPATEDVAPIVGGASRMQQLIEELLAGAGSRNRVGGGLPF